MRANLKAEMARAGITGQDLAEKLGVTSGTFSMKLNGKRGFTLDEALEIKGILRCETPVETLFLDEKGA